MKIVGIDSMVLIFARAVPVVDDASQQPEARKLRDEHGRRAQILLRHLAKKNARVILPTVAITELLVKVPDSEKGTLIAALAKRFVCPTLDLRASAIAAGLWAEFRKLPLDKQYSDRNVLKADAMIIGSAIAAGATEFYSHDRTARNLANLRIKGLDLPTRDPDGGFDFPDES